MKLKLPLKLLSVIFILKAAYLPAAVLVKDKMWPKNFRLDVVFIDGEDWQKALVKKYAPLWTKNSSLSLKFYDGLRQAPKQTHIRISFSGYNGSRLGNHQDYLAKQATLLLSALNKKNLSETEARRVILHEFGHALGFEHEYLNPNWPYGRAAIDQLIAECIPRFQKINYSLEQAKLKCHQINQPLAADKVHATIFDEFSIMNYPQKIPLADGSIKKIKTATELSALDELAIERWYGK